MLIYRKLSIVVTVVLMVVNTTFVLVRELQGSNMYMYMYSAYTQGTIQSLVIASLHISLISEHILGYNKDVVFMITAVNIIMAFLYSIHPNEKAKKRRATYIQHNYYAMKIRTNIIQIYHVLGYIISLWYKLVWMESTSLGETRG